MPFTYRPTIKQVAVRISIAATVLALVAAALVVWASALVVTFDPDVQGIDRPTPAPPTFAPSPARNSNDSVVILVSIDGFRASYWQDFNHPTLSSM